MLQIEIANHQSIVPVNDSQLVRAVREIVQGGFQQCEISVAVVDNATIHDLNKQHLQHDYATDVLSFVLEQDDHFLAGEIIVSGEMAFHQAAHYGWQPSDELLLYVIHGALHLIGFDDHTAKDKAAMRQQEQACLATFGLQPQERGADEPGTDGSC